MELPDAASSLPEIDRSFYAPPGEVADWRLALMYDAAVGAGLLDALPASPAQLSAVLGLEAHAVRVVLDALVTWGVVQPGQNGRYALGRDAPDQDQAAVIRHHARAVRRWSALIDDRLRGVDDNAAAWRPDAAQRALWLRALAVFSRRWIPAAVDTCLALAPHTSSVLDIGGGHGEYAREFARRGLRAVLQDTPETIEMLQSEGWLHGSGVELFPGDFFATLPAEKFDLVVCAGVTYTFGAQRNLELFQQVHSVLAPGGVLAIQTFLRGDSSVGSIFAMQMLLVGTDADVHSEEEYRSWLKAAAFGSVQVRVAGERPNALIFAVP